MSVHAQRCQSHYFSTTPRVPYTGLLLDSYRSSGIVRDEELQTAVFCS